MKKGILILVWSLFCIGLSVSCRPFAEETVVTDVPPLFPDYVDIAVPYNIAPLNFLLRNDPERVEVRLTGKQAEYTFIGQDGKMQFPEKEWKTLLEKETGNTLKVAVKALVNDRWLVYPVFTWKIRPEGIDPYLSYRLSIPDGNSGQKARLVIRNLATFEEAEVIPQEVPALASQRIPAGSLTGKMGVGEYSAFAWSDSSTRLLAAHTDFYREVLESGGKIGFLDQRTGKLAVSSDTTGKALWAFPEISPDQKSVYYCKADAAFSADSLSGVRYRLFRRDFYPERLSWGNRADTLVAGADPGKSLTHLALSPDGKYLLYTVSDFGKMPEWHRESDLRLLRLADGRVDSLSVVNAAGSDVSACWSSDSRWFVFNSKRDDGFYEKTYFCYVDSAGVAAKPFMLPLRDPSVYDYRMEITGSPALHKTAASVGSPDLGARKPFMKGKER